MAKKLALIHTSHTLAPMFTALCSKWMPEVKVFHMVDESLIRNTIDAGKLEKLTIRRLGSLVESAEEAGADAVLVTCSSIGEGTTLLQQLFDIPVVRVDEAMAENAVQRGKRIGVLATLKTTLEPTIQLVERKASGKDVEVIAHLCEGAFEAVLSGDTATHDGLVSKALLDLMPKVDVIVLAQASMARVLTTMQPESITVPVLSSPELAVERVSSILNGSV